MRTLLTGEKTSTSKQNAANMWLAAIKAYCISFMTIEKVKQEIKGQFTEISEALFQGSVSIQEVDDTQRVFAEASPMFGLNILRYSETNFAYFYTLLKYILSVVDVVNLKVIEVDYPKLDPKQDLLATSSISNLSAYTDKPIASDRIFLELNYIIHLFVFLHECGHLNQAVQAENEGVASNHFSEFNADYYALSKILQYYYSMKSRMPQEYAKRVFAFGGERNFIRILVVISVFVIFLEVVPKFNSDDTETHPAIRKRFCYLIFQTIEQLKDNFNTIFVGITLKDFAVEIFNTISFIENSLFESEVKVFGNLLNFCLANFDDVKEHLKDSSLFVKFNE